VCPLNEKPANSTSAAAARPHTIDEGQSETFTVTVENDPSGKDVTWGLAGSGCSGSACGTLSNVGPFPVTYNAPPVDLNVTVTGCLTAAPSNCLAFTTIVSVPPSITTATLPNGGVGAAYNVTLQGAGGAGTLTWAVTSGALPTGLSLSTSGVISGTASATGTATFTVTLTDSSTATQGPASAQKH
jgi:hypothetical protein